VNRLGTSVRSNTVTTRTLAEVMVPGPVVTVPDPPSLTSAVAARTRIDIAFERPVSDGGGAITQYQASVDDGVTWRDVPGTGTGPFTAQLTGLAPNTVYAVVVRAFNDIGASGPSNSLVRTTVRCGPGRVAAGSAARLPAQVLRCE
jgi:hypothetical protein